MKDSKNLDFSVVVCCYNPDFDKLKKTIISILKQEGVSFEIIISDDGSEVCYLKELKDWIMSNKIQNIKFNFLDRNVGTVKNLVSGIECSCGRYIKVLSPGDYLFNNQSLKRYKTEFENSGCDLIASRAVYYNQGGKIFNIKAPGLKSSNKNKYLKRNICFFRDFVNGATLAYKRELIEILYEVSPYVKFVEDYPLVYLSLMKNKKFVLIDDYLIWYEYGSGISTNMVKLVDNDVRSFHNFLGIKYKNNKEIMKSLKYIKLLKNKQRIKACVLNPAFLYEKIIYKLFYKYTKKRKVDLNLIHEITTFEKRII